MQDYSIKTRLVRFKIPRYATCPFCNKRQSLKKQKEHSDCVIMSKIFPIFPDGMV